MNECVFLLPLFSLHYLSLHYFYLQFQFHSANSHLQLHILKVSAIIQLNNPDGYFYSTFYWIFRWLDTPIWNQHQFLPLISRFLPCSIVIATSSLPLLLYLKWYYGTSPIFSSSLPLPTILHPSIHPFGGGHSIPSLFLHFSLLFFKIYISSIIIITSFPLLPSFCCGNADHPRDLFARHKHTFSFPFHLLFLLLSFCVPWNEWRRRGLQE